MRRIDLSRPTVALLGNLLVERVCRLAQWPPRNRRSSALGSHQQLGGVGAIARRLREFDAALELRLWTAIGDDDTGAIALSSLVSVGLRSDEVRVVAGVPTSSSTTLVDDASGERTSIVDVGACTHAAPPIEGPKVDWCHVAYLDTLSGIDVHDLRALRGRGTRVSVELCRTEFEERERRRLFDAFTSTDFLVISDVECHALLGSAGPDAARELGRAVAGWAVVHHAGGSWFANRRRCYEVRFEREAGMRDPLDAGDSFAAALIHRLLADDAIDAAVSAAHELAADSSRAHGFSQAD